MTQSPLEIIEALLFGAAMALAVALMVYLLTLIWNRGASLCAIVVSWVDRKIRRGPRPPSAAKAALRRG